MNGDPNQENNWRPMRGRRKKFFGLIILILIILAIFCWHHHDYYGYPGEAANLHTIAVSGHGEVFASPDVATFSFGALGQGATVAEAQDKMTKIANAAIDFVKKSGVDAKDIQTTNYSVNPTYKYESTVCPAGYPCPPSGNPTISGYEVSETLTVKLRDTSKSSNVLGGLGSLGVTNISGLSFTIDNPDALKEQARKMAIDKAMAEADQLAKDLHIHLKKIVSFTESGNNPGPIPFEVQALSADKGVAAPTIETGQNKITSDVTITYEIR
jgi:uncharacterized protein YggE